MISAMWNGATIAQSDATIEVEGNHYFPRSSVNRDYLLDSPTTSVCPWKGVARYHSLSVKGSVNADAAWYYPDPLPAAAEIKDHIAFWRGVQVA